MKFGKMFGYSFKGVIKSGAYRVLLLGVILSMALPILFLTVTDSMLYTVREKKKDLYGEFTDIYYGKTEAENIDSSLLSDTGLQALLSQAELQKIKCSGNLYSVDLTLWDSDSGETQGDGKSDVTMLEPLLKRRIENSEGFLGIAKTEGLLAAGFADEEARSLGRLSLKDGRWPEEGEAVLTESLQRELTETGAGTEEVNIGDFVSLCGKQYEISGIANDYGMLWVSNVNQSASDRVIPEILLSEKDFAELVKIHGSGKISHRILIESVNSFSGSVYENDYRMVQNSAIRSERFSVPLIMLVLVYICSALLLIQILLLGLSKLELKMRMYRLLGVEAGAVPVLLYFDLFWVFLLAMPMGILFGILGAYLICAVGSGLLHLEFLFRIRPWEILGALFVTGGILALSGVFPAIRLSRTKILEEKKMIFKKRRHFLSGFFLCLLIFCIFFLYGAASCYLKADEQLNLSVPLYGKMATDYDYEFLAGVISSDTSYVDEDGNYVGMSVMEPDDIFTVYNEPYLGMEEEEIKLLENTAGVRKVSAYKECSQLKMPLDRNDPYQRALEDEIMAVGIGGYSDKITEIFDLEESYVDVKLQSYPEDELLSLASYVEEGSIDLDKIRSGEEVVLVVPDIQVDIEEYENSDGSMGSVIYLNYLEKGVYSGQEGQYRDTYYHVGDTVTLTRLYSENQGLRGFVKEKTVCEEVKRQDISLKIGAVIRCKAGWFEKNISPDPFYSFLCLDETFDAVGISSTYTRVRICGKGGTDGNALKQTVYRISGGLPEMELEDRCGFMEEYRQYHMLLSVLGELLIGLSAIMGTGMFIGRMLMKIRESRKKTGLYQIVGFTRQELFWKRIQPFAVQIPFMWAAAMTAVWFLSEKYYRLNGYWGIEKSFLSLAAAALLAGIAIVICAGCFFKESISSLIREED